MLKKAEAGGNNQKTRRRCRMQSQGRSIPNPYGSLYLTSGKREMRTEGRNKTAQGKEAAEKAAKERREQEAAAKREGLPREGGAQQLGGSETQGASASWCWSARSPRSEEKDKAGC
eukprot:4945508-Amphidinium_carterae.1